MNDIPHLPPDAAERDAAKRQQVGEPDDVIQAADFRFITKGVSDAEQAAVVAVISAVRTEETRRVRKVERREHEPWSRSQRVPEGIGEFLLEG